MNKKAAFAAVVICGILIFDFPAGNAHGQGGTLVIRQAQEDGKAACAVEAYLDGDILDMRVSAWIDNSRPSILNVILTGPGIGTLVPITIAQVYATGEQEEPYETTKIGGFLSRSKPTKKLFNGSVSRKQVRFKVPAGKIKKGADYQLKVKVGSVKQASGSGAKITRFWFHLEDLPEQIQGQ